MRGNGYKKKVKMGTKLKLKSCAILSIAVVMLMSSALLAVPISVAEAQEGAPPVLPCAFYGNITIDEKPAPIGTEITAKMDNKTYGNITVVEEGKYGGHGGFDPKLLLIGEAADENRVITFYVDGNKTEETAIWNSGGVNPLDLSVKIPAVSEGEEGAGASPIAVVLIVFAVVVVAALIVVGWRKRRER